MRRAAAGALLVSLLAGGALGAWFLPRWAAERSVTALAACLAGQPLLRGETGEDRVQRLDALVDRRRFPSWPKRCRSIAEDVAASEYIARIDPRLQAVAQGLLPVLKWGRGGKEIAEFLEQSRVWPWHPGAAGQGAIPQHMLWPPEQSRRQFRSDFVLWGKGAERDAAGSVPFLSHVSRGSEASMCEVRGDAAPLSIVRCKPPDPELLWAVPVGGGGELGMVSLTAGGLQAEAPGWTAPDVGSLVGQVVFVTEQGTVVTSCAGEMAPALVDEDWRRLPSGCGASVGLGGRPWVVSWARGEQRLSEAFPALPLFGAGQAFWQDAEGLWARKILDEPPGFGPPVRLGASAEEEPRVCQSPSGLVLAAKDHAGQRRTPPEDRAQLRLFFFENGQWRGPVAVPKQDHLIGRWTLTCGDGEARVGWVSLRGDSDSSMRVFAARCSSRCVVEEGSVSMHESVLTSDAFFDFRALLVPLGERSSLLWTERGFLRARSGPLGRMDAASEQVLLPVAGGQPISLAEGSLLSRGDLALLPVELASGYLLVRLGPEGARLLDRER